MSTVLVINPYNETAGSVAKRTSAGLKDCTPNCPPDCPDCGQISFRQLNEDVYTSYNKQRKKKRNFALLTGAGILAVGAASMIGLGKLHNSAKIAGLKDGWFKTGMENVTRGCHNACQFIKNKSVQFWEWIKKPFSKNS